MPDGAPARDLRRNRARELLGVYAISSCRALAECLATERAVAPADILNLELLSVTHCQGEVFLRYRVPNATPYTER